MPPVDLSRAVWRKSSRSGLNGGTDDCVELAALHNDLIAVRDSKCLDGAVLFCTRPELAAWIKAVKHHKSNDLT
ncbi:MAG: DUF397 domain-containing protein [Pseudonocardiaceae bacterium]